MKSVRLHCTVCRCSYFKNNLQNNRTFHWKSMSNSGVSAVLLVWTSPNKKERRCARGRAAGWTRSEKQSNLSPCLFYWLFPQYWESHHVSGAVPGENSNPRWGRSDGKVGAGKSCRGYCPTFPCPGSETLRPVCSKKRFLGIAAEESVTGNCTAASVTGAITKLQKFFY